MKRLLLSAACLPLLGPALREESIALGYEAGDEVTRTFVASAEYDMDSLVYYADGEQVGELEEIDFSLTSLERIVVTDTILEVDDGRPTDFRRTFDELLQENTVEQADESTDSSYGSDLEGETVRFLWDDGDEEYYVEAESEDEIESSLLEYLEADMDFTAFLPDGEVEEGDEWEIDGSAYLQLMWPGGLFGFYDDEIESEEDPSERASNVQGIENLTGTGTVTFVGVEDVDGERVALLRVEIEVETWTEREDEENNLTIEREFERSIEGELRWDLAHGMLLSATLEADSEWTTTRTQEAEIEGETYEIGEATTFSGTIEYEVTFERE